MFRRKFLGMLCLPFFLQSSSGTKNNKRGSTHKISNKTGENNALDHLQRVVYQVSLIWKEGPGLMNQHSSAIACAYNMIAYNLILWVINNSAPKKSPNIKYIINIYNIINPIIKYRFHVFTAKMEGVHRLTAQGKPVQVAPSMQEPYSIPVNTHLFP